MKSGLLGKVSFEFSEREGRTRCGRLLVQFLLFASLCPAAVCCAAAEGALPNILANDNRVAAGRLDSGVLTLHLELRKGVWHPEEPDGRRIEVYSFAEEGNEPQAPGPLIRVPQATTLRVSVRNLLPFAAFVHGLHEHPGKPEDFIQVAPGETRETHFAAGEPGSYIYWAFTSPDHRHATDGPMSGAFIVDPPDASAADRIFLIQVWAQHLFDPKFKSTLVINGKSWPYTERLHARLGRPEHWRVLNATPIAHPMHLHGFYFRVDAMGDGETERRLSETEQRMVVTQAVEPGHSFDMTWIPERAGNWIFHCHILDHMSKEPSPVMYGPEGTPAMREHDHGGYDANNTGMAALVLGITVTDDKPRFVPANAVIQPAAAEKHLFVRARPAQLYVPAPGFYLEGVSREVGAVGPPLVITRAERTAITVTNELREPTAIHWHGIEIESYYDGVPGWDGSTQQVTPPIAPGSSFIAYMTPPRAGTFIYHTHWHDVKQLTGGMYGALLVLEPGQKYDPATDRVFVLGRSGPNEMRDPLVLNGSPQPGLMVLLSGQIYRFRFINITPGDSPIITSLTSEGHPAKWRAIAKDGANLPPQQATMLDAVQPISVGETYDFEFTPKEPGDYALRFLAERGSELTQVIAVVLRSSPFSVFATKR
jgi:FtsP/CotA-like multicopper oxidase with cupredoxin domain